jgi:hypothetical protein
MSIKKSKILISIALLSIVASALPVSFAGDLAGWDGLHKLEQELHNQKGQHGDCWGVSDYAAGRLANNGYQVAIVEGPSAYADNHHQLVVYMAEDGKVHWFEGQRAERDGLNAGLDYCWFKHGVTPSIYRAYNGFNYQVPTQNGDGNHPYQPPN